MKRRTQTGFSLVELMVSLALGLIIMAGVYQVFATVIGTSGQTLKVSQLNQQMRAVMGIMTQELQRIGYWADAINQDPTTNPNPFGFTIGSTSWGTGDDCILYSYDYNQNGIEDADEQIGFRLNTTGALSTVQWSKGLSTAVTDCSANWGSGTYINLNDERVVKIDQLTFKAPPAECTNLSTVPRSNCNPCDADYQAWAAGDTLVKVPRIDITVSGYLKTDPNMRVTLTQTVRVRNSVIEIAAAPGPAPGTGCSP